MTQSRTGSEAQRSDRIHVECHKRAERSSKLIEWHSMRTRSLRCASLPVLLCRLNLEPQLVSSGDAAPRSIYAPTGTAMALVQYVLEINRELLRLVESETTTHVHQSIARYRREKRN